MKACYVLGIILAGALSMGCAAQTGTEESSQAEGLTADHGAQVVQQKQEALTKQRIVQVFAQPAVHTGVEVPHSELDGVVPGTDPGGNSQDDGDGKEPDPHPWHTSTATLASH